METPYGASLASQLSAIPLRTDDDVLARVAAILEPAARRDPTLWVFFLGPDGLQSDVAIPFDDLPAYPGPDEAEGMFEMLAHLVSPDGPAASVILTITRSGIPRLSGSDRRWAAVLRRGAAQNGTPVRMLCLATPDGVRELTAADPHPGGPAPSGPAPSAPSRPAPPDAGPGSPAVAG